MFQVVRCSLGDEDAWMEEFGDDCSRSKDSMMHTVDKRIQ